MTKSSTCLAGLVLSLGLTFRGSAQTTNAPETSVLVQGRALAAWVAEVEIGGAPGANIATKVLISAGPPIVPALSRFLVGKESTNDLTMRLPAVPTPTQNVYASTLDTLEAKAVWGLGAIAYRNPNAPEVLELVPLLTTALRSENLVVRYLSAQALLAIGKGATNAVPRLISSTRDECSGVRMSAVEALGRIGARSPEALAAVKAALCLTPAVMSESLPSK